MSEIGEAFSSSGQSQVPTQSSANPVLDSLSAAIQHAQAQVTAANQQAARTPPFVQGSSAQPTMPVPKPTLFPNASASNLNNIQPQTRAGARAKGIGQLAATGANIIGTFMKKKEAEKTQQLALDINRSLELTKGIDEAKQILATDPNNAEAKAQLQKNQTLMAHLLSDPKRAKAIAKAYDITFGEGAQKSAEAGADKDKMEKQAMTGAMRAQQFQDQMPQRMQANPNYELAQKNAQALQKQADDLIKTYTNFAGKVYTAQAADARAAAADASRERVAATNVAGRVEVEKSREAEANKMEEQRHKDRMAEIGAQGANRLAAIKEAKKLQSNDEGVKMATKWNQELGAELNKNNDELSKINSQITAAQKADKDEELPALKAEKERLTAERTLLQQHQDEAVMEMHRDPNAAAMFNIINDPDQF